MVYASTEPGELLAVDATTGEVTWTEEIGFHAWSSPVIVGEELLVATCTGEVHAYSLADPRHPVLTWSFKLSESCIESTPAVWNGRFYVGVRDGKFYAVGSADGKTALGWRRAKTKDWDTSLVFCLLSFV